MKPGAFRHHYRCVSWRDRGVVDDWSQCSIFLKVHLRAFLEASAIMAALQLLAITSSFF